MSVSNNYKRLAQAYAGGQWLSPAEGLIDVVSPYDGGLVGRLAPTSREQVAYAVAQAVAAKPDAAALPGHRRAALLRRAADLLEQRLSTIANLMAAEVGKAVKDATGELRRSMDTILLSAEEAIRIEGEQVPLDGSDMGAGKYAFLLRFPVGVVGAITPFNAPFNLAVHKLAPALAAGNTIILKAPPQAPLTAQAAASLFIDAGFPDGCINLLHGGSEVGKALVADPGVDFITFTGSSAAGLHIKAASGFRRVALELGGNSPTIVHSDADVEVAAATCAVNGTRLAGQSCISVQNVYVHSTIVASFIEAMIARLSTLKVGDPSSPDTDIGTLIDEAAATRVESWVKEAVAGGAEILFGGDRKGAQLVPTLLTNVDPAMKVVCQEVFGPVISIIPYDDIESVFAVINASDYGLQCGLFTFDTRLTFHALREIRTGGLIVNGSSTWRTDQLAYGGVKASGSGREGPRYAIRDMTEERLVVFNL